MEQISLNVWLGTLPNSSDDPAEQLPPALISIRFYDADGKVIKSYENITSLSDGERIAFSGPGNFKVNVANNNADSAVTTQLQIQDVTRIPNHPLEAMGQWLTIISLPVFGLAVWFIIRSRQKPMDDINS